VYERVGGIRTAIRGWGGVTVNGQIGLIVDSVETPIKVPGVKWFRRRSERSP
jgi:hypothetical protein